MNVSKYCADPSKLPGKQITSDDEQGHKRSKGKKHPKFNRGVKWAFIIIASVMLITTFVLVYPLISKKAQHGALICIPAGAKFSQIEDSISKYIGENYAKDTHRALQVMGVGDDNIPHGAWYISEGMTPFQAARLISRGGQTGISVTLNNQRSLQDVARVLSAKLEFSEQEFLDAVNDAQLLKKYDTDPDHILTFFFKDTYEFFWTATPEDVIATMRENYRRFWTSDRRNKADALRISPRDMVVLASIVDAETEDSNEKGTIGRLYINRLDEGMKLQSDPTVIYAVGDFSITRVGGEMLHIDSPYNTYKYDGLPPGPIRLTSASTIDAILTSRPNDYLYMCADESLNGTHNFAITYQEHLENSKRYRQELDRRGITLSKEEDMDTVSQTNIL